MKNEKINKLVVNFGKCNAAYTNFLSEIISSGKKVGVNKNNKPNSSNDIKGVFNKYINLLRENKVLKTQYHIYSNIESKIESDKDKALEFVKENLSLMNKFSKKEISETNKIIDKILNNIPSSKLDGYYNVSDSVKKLHEDISTLINTKKMGNTISVILETNHKIVDYILNNKEDKKEIVEGLDDTVLSSKDLSKLMVSRFNKEYSKSLSESEVSLLKSILTTSSDEDKKNVMFKESINECLSLVNGKLKVADVDLKMSLLDLKENLLDKKYNNDSFEVDILKLNTLKESLK
tara:strand:+ start:424 stop:1299 length:876 start_codon:yes stop_codon:yes gene_type:complete